MEERAEPDSAESSVFARLADPDLLGLRLAAQVLAHKAELERRTLVAAYFGRLEYAIQAELASRLTGIRALPESTDVALEPGADEEDERLVSDYLGLLVVNEKLSPDVREACHRLRERTLA